jgi:hypothetical protein
MTDEEIHAAALSDPDTQPLPLGSDEEMAKLGLIHISNVKKLRERLGLWRFKRLFRFRPAREAGVFSLRLAWGR